MKSFSGVMASNSLNRNFSRFTVGALFGMLHDNVHGIPMLISHDATRPIGWSQPRALLIEPGIARVIGVSSLPDNEDDRKQLQYSLDQFTLRAVANKNEDFDRLRALVKHGVERDAMIVPMGNIVAVAEPSLARRVCPDVFGLEDKDNLVPLAHLTIVGPGVYRSGELLLFAHPYLRRSQSRLNPLNDGFLRLLQSSPKDRMTAKVALDPDVIGLASTYDGSWKIELEYWWGPKFTDEVTSIPPGVTHHAASDDERHFHLISATQFWWQSRDGLHSFEAEELRDAPTVLQIGTVSATKYACRYAHSIVSEASGEIGHFDGAIRAYDEIEMLVRLDKTIAEAGRHTAYTKLWRIDGTIKVSEWKALLSEYYRDNRLVGEYLGGSSDEEVGTAADAATSISQPPPATASVKERLVPYAMSEDDGIRLAITFWPPAKSVPETTFPYASPDSTLVYGEDHLPAFDSYALELRKALLRNGSDLYFPPNAVYLSYRDRYVCLPLVHVQKEQTAVQLPALLSALDQLVSAWNRQDAGTIVCFRIALPLEDRQVVLSIMATAGALASWFADPLAQFPTTVDELRSWTDKAAEFITASSRIATRSWPGLVEIDGVLSIHRERANEITVKFDAANQIEGYDLCTDDETIVAAMDNNEIAAAVGIAVAASTCSRCGGDYHVCPCSRIIDENVTRHIEKVSFVMPFWTDKPR